MIKIKNENKEMNLIGFDDWANDHCAIFTENENEETFFAFNWEYENERSKELGIGLNERLTSEKIREAKNPQKGKIKQILKLPEIVIEISEAEYEIFSNGEESFEHYTEHQCIKTETVSITEVVTILDEYDIDYSSDDESFMLETEPKETLLGENGNVKSKQYYVESLEYKENNFPINSKELLKTILKKYGREY